MHAEHAAAERRLTRMAAALAHRGPDGEGFFVDREHRSGAAVGDHEGRGGAAVGDHEGRSGAAGGSDIYLGHRRLSIFDPSERGAQPMSDRSGRYTVVFNGAIYNFVELAQELATLPGHDFQPRGHSDTEVLVEAWAAWGAACLSRLNGMFAFALWDGATRTLYLARDRFGVKPLHYAFLGDGPSRLLFASEQKALFAAGLAPHLDRRALADFLLTHNIDHHPERTLFAGVLQVPPAGLLTVRPGQAPQLTRYWQIQPTQPTSAQAQRSLSSALAEETRELVLSALSLRLRSDVPLGGTLSGGLDSSLLTAAAAGPLLQRGLCRAPYRVFMSQFPNTSDRSTATGDESPWAERVLAHLQATAPAGAPPPVLGLRSSPEPSGLRRDLAQVLYHQEEPFADTSIFAHYALMRRVAEADVKVLITGQGADEIFAGYPSYFNVFLGGLLREGRPRDALAQARARVALVGGDARRLLVAAAYHAAPGALREPLHHRRVAREFPLSAVGRALLVDGDPRYADGGGGARGERWGRADQPGFSLFASYLLDSVERWSLPHILRQDDRNTMAFGIESRAPFLDYRLAELAFRSRPEAHLWGGYTKRLLREAARGLLPEDVRLRPDKIGFWSPQQAFLRGEEAWVREIAGRLPDAIADLVDAAGWQRVLTRFYQHGDGHATAALWAGFVTSLFVRDTLPRLAALAQAEPRVTEFPG